MQMAQNYFTPAFIITEEDVEKFLIYIVVNLKIFQKMTINDSAVTPKIS